MRGLRSRRGSAFLHRTLIVTAALGAGTVVGAGQAAAVPIPADLLISGSVEMSTAGQSPFSDGNVSQTGTIRRTVGGSTTNSNFSTTPGAADGNNDNNTTMPAPLTGSLTDTGDGFGHNTNLNAAFETGFDFNEGYDFVIDLVLDFMNTSATDTYTVTLRINYSQTADVSGNDSFADGGLDIEEDDDLASNTPGTDIENSDVASDTFLGDSRNGSLLGTFGDTVSDSNDRLFDITLMPGAVWQVAAIHQWEGGVFEDPGSSRFSGFLDITVSAIACDGPSCGGVVEPPDDVPEPATLSVLALGLLGLGLVLRRQQRRRG